MHENDTSVDKGWLLSYWFDVSTDAGIREKLFMYIYIPRFQVKPLVDMLNERWANRKPGKKYVNFNYTDLEKLYGRDGLFMRHVANAEDVYEEAMSEEHVAKNVKGYKNGKRLHALKKAA